MTQSPIEKAKEALRPFSFAADMLIRIHRTDQLPDDTLVKVELGDLRRAREALKALEGNASK